MTTKQSKPNSPTDITKILSSHDSPHSSKDSSAFLRVCAYCRVSTDMEDQRTSFQAQVTAYTDLITSNPEWIFAGIYADEGISGTRAEKRPQFMKMIRACKAGKIDLILTKSISRFARNTLECLMYVRCLRELGVHILFESNHLDTRTQYSEMLLTVLAAFAQEESRSISENTAWGIRKRFEEGHSRWCNIYGYQKSPQGEYEIVPAEAEVIKKVFQLYEKGNSITDIQQILEAERIASPKGHPTWSRCAIQSMLTNVKYCRDILMQKFYTRDHISHKSIKNDCSILPSYYLHNHHAGIIERKQFERVQHIRTMRRCRSECKNGTTNTCDQYPFGELLKCPHCSSTLYQRTVPVQTLHTTGWCCERGDNACQNFIIRSHLVEKAILLAYKNLSLSDIQNQLSIPNYKEQAKMALHIKTCDPTFNEVHYWWVDDLIQQIEFGKHTITQRSYMRGRFTNSPSEDDRIIHITWKCGLETILSSGVINNADHPATVARLYNHYKNRHNHDLPKQI